MLLPCRWLIVGGDIIYIEKYSENDNIRNILLNIILTHRKSLNQIPKIIYSFFIPLSS